MCKGFVIVLKLKKKNILEFSITLSTGAPKNGCSSLPEVFREQKTKINNVICLFSVMLFHKPSVM